MTADMCERAECEPVRRRASWIWPKLICRMNAGDRSLNPAWTLLGFALSHIPVLLWYRSLKADGMYFVPFVGSLSVQEHTIAIRTACTQSNAISHPRAANAVD